MSPDPALAAALEGASPDEGAMFRGYLRQVADLSDARAGLRRLVETSPGLTVAMRAYLLRRLTHDEEIG